jgi:hypothetical protein
VADEPRTLLLPSWMLASFDVARAIAEERRWSWSEGWRLLERFEMASHERGFVKTVLERRSNLWLFRTNQRMAAGDFIAVDMSPPLAIDRTARVIELKTGARLVLGGSRLQCAEHRAAVDEIVEAGIVDAASPVELVYGDHAAVLAHLGVSEP